MSQRGTQTLSTTQEIVDLIKKLNQDDKVTAIIVTHDRHVAEQTNRIVEMLDGRIIGAE